jgi:hypothetical protein
MSATRTQGLFSAHFGPDRRPLFQAGRRGWLLQAGLTGLAGISLPGLLQARQAAGQTARPVKSVIQIWLSGGPSQIDMWDMKPDMSPEIRGPFQPISTAVPGVRICEHLPLQAAMMDRFVLVRSMDASSSNHTPITFQRRSGRRLGGREAAIPRWVRWPPDSVARINRACRRTWLWRTAWSRIFTVRGIWGRRGSRWMG